MLLSVFPASPALAAACSSAATGNWSAPATWSSCGGGVPGAADTVTVNSTHTITLTANAAAAGITINAATAANGITLSGFTLNVNGAITMTAPSFNSVTSTFNVGAGTLTAASITINGRSSSRVALMTVSSGTITTTGSINFAGTSSNARFTSTGASTVNVGGNFGSGGTLAGGTGTINFNGGAAQTIGAYTTYNNVTINNSAGGVALAGSVTIGGTLTVTRGTFSVGTANFQVNGPTNIGDGTLVATLNQSSATGTAVFVGLVTVYPSSSWTNTSNESVTFRGGITSNGTFSAGTATQTFSTNSQAIGGSSAITIQRVTVTGSGVALTNNGTLTVATALGGTGGLTNSSVGTLNIDGTSSVATIANAGVANISGSGAITTATLTNTGTLNLSGTNTITAITNSSGGTLNVSSTASITTLTANASGNTVNYTGAAQTVKATTYHHLNLGGSGAKAMATSTVNGNFSLTGTAANAPSGALTVRGDFTIGAGTTFTAGALSHSVGGNWSNSGTFTAGTGTVTFNGTAQQTFTGATTFANLTLNNAAGFAINNNMTVSTVLTLTSGGVTTSGNTLVASANCPGSISRTNGYVIGNLQLTIPTTNPVTCSYPVGDSIGYAPISIAKTGTNTGTLTGRVDSGDHPDGSAAVGINQLKNANHYWTLTAGTLSSATYTATFQFCATGACVIPTEVDSGAVTGNFIVTKKSGTWSSQTVGTKTATSTQATGLTSFGIFDVGEMVTTECVSQATGNWNASSTWTSCRGGIPLTGDNATIANGHNVTLNVNTPTLNSLAINSGGTLTNTGSNTITLSNAMLNAGTYSGGSGAVIVPSTFTNTGSYSAGSATTTLSGNFSNSGTFTAGTGTWAFSGSSAQSIAGVTGFYNLTVNNASGISLSDSVSVSHLLTLTSGNITTGANSISVLTATCPGSISRASGFVIGKLRLTFPTASTACTYYVGSGTTYAPIGVTLTGGGTLTGSTTGNEHPQVANSGIDSALDVNRYWSLWSSGDTVNASSYSPTFNFNAGDADALATPTRFVVGKYTGSSWSLITPSSGSALATSTAVSITAAITSPTDFISGEAVFVCSVPSGSPAGTTCVCDNFTRTILNPSTIYSGNWQVSSSGIHAFLPQIVNGRLRLTDNNSSESIAATGPGTFPAAGNRVTAEFKHYAYGGSGGDGLALTLSDSTITAVPGAFGGSLGYAQKSNPGSDCTTTGGCPGFAGGWIGIAIDEFGNFSVNSEGRTGGSAPGLSADSVAVRGSGSGQTGYPYLGGTSTLSPAIDRPSPATDGFGHLYRLTVDARCYQADTISADVTCNNPTLAKTALVTVERDTTGTGSSYATLLGPFDAYTVNPSQANVPTNWQLSFTGSTGGSANIHEISGMKVCAQTYTPPAGYRILVDNFSPTTCASDPQPTVTISAFDSNNNIITAYANTVNLSATLSGGGASSATWTSQATNQGTFDSVNKRYTFAAGDNGVAKFTLSDATAQNVYVTVSEYLGTLNSTLGTPVQYSSGVASFVVDIPPAEALGSGVVAGRAHLMQIRRNTAVCGGGADASYTGTKPLDGWYNPALSDHPTGAVAPQICAPVSGVCQPSYVTGSCQTLSIAAPALSSSSNNLSLSFTGGVANFCLVTADVGKYTINLRDDTTVPASPVYGASATLTARPFAVAVSNIVQGAISNPGSNTPSGTFFAKAGSSFQATVGGYLWDTAGDANGDGLPESGATLTQTIGSGIAPSYADTVVLSATTPFAPATLLDTPAGTGTGGALSNGSNGSVTITGGSATPSTLSYSEVGSFTLKAEPSTNYLNSGIDLSPRVAIFSQPDYTFQSALVGRFIPDHFLLSSAISSAACTTHPAAYTNYTPTDFTYFGQDGFTTTFTLTAVNANGIQTNNYEGDGSSSTSWAKLPLTAWGEAPASASLPGYGFAAGIWSPLQPTGAVLAGSATQPIATNLNNWVSGSATVTAKHQVIRPTSPAVPTTVEVTALPVDSDGVTMTAATTLVTATPLRYGRLSLQNAYGSELLDLPIPVEAQYWHEYGYYTANTDDSCTAFDASSISMGNYLQNLNACETQFSPAGSLTMSGGILSPGLNLTAPGVGNTGSVDLTLNIGSIASGNTCITATEAAATPANSSWFGANPTAQATFGIYKGNSRFIYIRELY